MEHVAALIIGCLLSLTVLTTIVGITIYDIRRINSNVRSLRKQRFKKRPLVLLRFQSEPSEACIESIWNNDYQKIKVDIVNQPTQGKLILLMRADTVLDTQAISRAVRMFEQNPSLTAMEILPKITEPQTLLQFFKNNRLIASGPLSVSRTGFGIALPESPYPVMLRPNSRQNWHTSIYKTTRWLVQAAIFITLIYACSLAVSLGQPTLFISCVVAFVTWMCIAIMYYPHMSLRQKFFYLFLIPVSILYFSALHTRATIRPLFRLRHNKSALPSWKTTHKYIAVF